MAYTKSDWTTAITRLIERTSRGTYRWDVCSDFQEEPLEDTDQAFELIRNKSKFVIRSVRTREYYDSEPGDFIWSGKYYVLDIYREDSNGVWKRITTAPSQDSIRDLFRKVESAYAHQEGILKELLDPDVFD